ncbi:MAG: pectate lyase [Candidatus Malihini olakiniferum]
MPINSNNWDLKIEKDDKAPRIWARFYVIKDNSAIFANRDGKHVYNYGDIALERRTGYG